MRLPFKHVLGALAALTAPALLPTAASAATIIGGATAVRITAAPALTGLGLSFSPFGTASLSGPPASPTATFLITGGSVNDGNGAALIEHNGSGLIFTGGGNTLSLGNFLIDTAAGTLKGSAIANGAPLGTVPIFTIGSGLVLNLTAQGAGAFTSVFGAPNLTGTQFGTADINFVTAASPVPESSTWAMLIAGFSLCGFVLRRRRTSARIPALV